MINLSSIGAEAVKVTADDLNLIPAPAGTHSWRPIPHSVVLNSVTERLNDEGVIVLDRNLKVSHQGSRFFGVLHVNDGNETDGYTLTVGVRNAHDKCFAAGVAAGMSVLVCSNLSFAGDVAFKRKHTVNIMNDLPELVKGGVDYLKRFWDRQARQVDAYRNTRLSELRARDLTIEALDNNVFSASRIPEVLQEWREPSHEEFKPRTVWSFFNSATEVLKKANPFTLPAKSRELHKVCDNFVGIS